ncbi:MAG: sodium:proton antiporter [Verrucomicrobiales bacterium]|jgi:Na+/H+ antiporter NhaD/arsenite permease-like protein|nr:sodium:proton antiporter [Verrucomicrobiales bacterium]
MFAAAELIEPNPWMIIPFAVMLLSIAVMPFISKHWWEKHYPKVAIALGSITLVYYLFSLKAHTTVLHTAHEYVSFIALIGSLFVISGGIHISLKGESTPAQNVVFLFIGSLLANIIGTTGASMLLIRPWIRMNKYRITAFHIVFFIFIVSNVAGCLTPIGDPPLFLGYLKGIPFFWTIEHLWIPWAFALGLLLAMFYCFDLKNFRLAPARVREAQHVGEETWKFDGMHNVFFLALVLAGVFLDSPWREALMVIAAVASYFSTKKTVHAANEFNFHPIKEVAFLFIGIFATMMPALDYLKLHAAELGIASPLAFYFSSGLLSGALDNAPTYLTFLSASIGLFVPNELLANLQQGVALNGTELLNWLNSQPADTQNTFATLYKYHGDLLANHQVPESDLEISYLIGNHNLYIIAVSLGSVFFGALTYIGNGPNFMVKAIADHAKVRVPGFVQYIVKYALPILLPILILTGLLFLKFFPVGQL